MLLPFRDDVPRERTPLVSYALIAVNVLAFIWFVMMPPVPQQEFMLHHAFIPARLTQLPKGEAVKIDFPLVVNDHGRQVLVPLKLNLPAEPREVLYTVVTSMFMHGGWGHLLGNMWFLWLFGGNVEDRLGGIRYIFLYLLGGAMAAGVQWLDNPMSLTPMVGASGAIAAVLGAYAITYPWARIHTLIFVIVFFTVIDLPAILFLGGWFVYQYLSARTDMQGGVAWWAHVGGFAAGLAIMPWIDPRRRLRGGEAASGDDDFPTVVADRIGP
jgi:membrane associated rhomboid family serine protease